MPCAVGEGTTPPPMLIRNDGENLKFKCLILFVCSVNNGRQNFMKQFFINLSSGYMKADIFRFCKKASSHCHIAIEQ